MDDKNERRVARNEALLREVNEGIERGRWPGEDVQRFRFRCECASLDCNGSVELTRTEYEHVRAHPRRFALHPGHELPDAETIVEVYPGYVVVEKREEAGVTAERLDPRS
jgi:hypothetical protein